MPLTIPSQLRQMPDVEAAWVGAMIEAEGSVILPKASAHWARISFVNTDLEVISAFVRFTGFGGVTLKTAYKPGKSSFEGGKAVYAWQLQAKNSVKDLVRQCARFSPKLQRLLPLLEAEHSTL